MAKETFDTFKRKIEERTGESIDKILGEDTDIELISKFHILDV
jgi:hypothetical protein